jgi:hypothetical protein
MEIRIFFAVLVAFVLLHFSFTISRTRRIQELLKNDKSSIQKNHHLAICSSLLIPLLAMITVLVDLSFPACTEFTVVFACMQSEPFKYAGLFFSKFSLIWALVTGMQVEKLLSAKEEIIGTQKLLKIEIVSSIGAVLFCTGVFLFQPNLVLLVLLLAALCKFSFKWNASFKAA